MLEQVDKNDLERKGKDWRQFVMWDELIEVHVTVPELKNNARRLLDEQGWLMGMDPRNRVRKSSASKLEIQTTARKTGTNPAGEKLEPKLATQ